MTEIQKVWLENLYRNELKEIDGTIDNEKLWEEGSTKEARELHKSNIEELKGYKALLQELIEQL